jgi:hypothetical protein
MWPFDLLSGSSGSSGSPDPSGGGILSGFASPSALYGNLLSPQQQGALNSLALAKMAGAIAPYTGATRLPVSLGGALAAAAGAGADATMQGGSNAIQAQYLGQQIQNLKTQNALSGLTLQGYQRLQQLMGGGAPTQGGALTASLNGGPVAPVTGDNHVANAAPASPDSLLSGNAPSGTTISTPGPNGVSSYHTVAGGSTPGVGAPTAGYVPPLFNRASALDQARIMLATPGLQQAGTALLTEIQKGLPTGYYLGVDGAFHVDPNYVTGQGAVSSAEAWGKAPAENWVNQQRPLAVRPNGAVISGGRLIAQLGSPVESVDPTTGARYQSYVQPPIYGGNGSLLNPSSTPPQSPLNPGAPQSGGVLSGNAQPAPVRPDGSLDFSGAQLPGSAPPSVPMAFKAAAGGVPAPTPAPIASPTTPPAPNGNPALRPTAVPGVSTGPGGTPVIQTSISPLQQESATEHAKGLEDYGKQISDNAVSAVNNNFLLDQMRNQSQTWAQGKFADAKNDALSYLDGFAKTFGLSDPGIAQRVGDFQSFNKNAMELTRQAVRATSGRAAVQEFTMIQQALPSAEMSQQGFIQIANQMSSLNDYHIATQQAAQAWRNSHNGTLDGFQATWQQQVTPAAFLAYRMSNQDMTTLRINLSKTAEGRAAYAHLQREVQFAQQNGLFGE